MKSDSRIVFFGGVGRPDQFGGEMTKNKEILRRLRDLGYSVFVIDTIGSRGNIGKLLAIALRFLYSILFLHKSTFVFSTSFDNMYPFLKLLARWPFRIQIVYWVIGGNFVERVKNGKYRKDCIDRVDLYIVEGHKMVSDFNELGYSNVIYAPNFKSVVPVTGAAKYDDGKCHFVFLSRIMAQKGAAYILESVKALNERGLESKFQVDFYGTVDSRFKDDFDEACRELPNVKYCGELQLQNPANFKTLARYHYMLFPTYWIGEGFPGVIIDAYMSGVPVIASDWNFNSEFVEDGMTGYIIPTHSSDALADKMQQVMSHRDDYEAMSSRCLEKVGGYDTSTVISPGLMKKITSR